MGKIQSKVTQSISLKQKPLFKKNHQLGQPPIFTSHKQSRKKTCIFKQESFKNIKLTQSTYCKTNYNDDFELYTDSEIQNMKEYPFCSMGDIIYVVEGNQNYASGFLISKNIVLSCAHNLISSECKQKATNVRFCPSYKEDKQKYIYKVKQIFFPKEFQKISLKDNELAQDYVRRNDFAVMKLQDNVDLTRRFNFVSQQHYLKSNKLILGFSNQKNKSITLQSFTRKVKFTQQFICYPFLAQVGISGGPILQVVDGNYIVIGIHTFYNHKQKGVNGQSLRLNQQKFEQINTWLKVQEEVLDLRDKNLGKESVKQLVKQQKYSFDVINLSKNCLQKQGLKHFSRVQWPKLYHLDLGGNNLGKEGLQYLIKTSINNLMVLNLWGNKIDKSSVQILVLGKWAKLQNLNLYNNQICIGGLQILIDKDWKCLNTLNLGKNLLGIQAIEKLYDNKWKDIVCLNLWGNEIKNDKEIVKILHLYFPKMKYLYL